MTPDETSDERDELLDLLASLRTDRVEPDADELDRARELGITDDEIHQRAAVMTRVRAGLGAMADRDEEVLARDELATRRSVQRAVGADHPAPTARTTSSAARRSLRIPSPLVAVAAATAIIAGVGLGGWIVAQDSSEQLASTDADESVEAESDAAPPALPPDVPVVGTAATPDEAIDVAVQHWLTTRTSSIDDTPAGREGFDDRSEIGVEREQDLAPAAGPDADGGDRCGAPSDPTRVVVVVIDDSPHLVVDAEGSVVVLRLVDCREVARA